MRKGREEEDFWGAGRPMPSVRIATRSRWGPARPVALPRLFRRPHGSLAPVQLAVASAVLSGVGISYVPGRVIRLTAAFDAFQAIDRFLQAIGVTYEELLRSAEVGEYLDFCLSTLAGLDAIRCRAGLDDVPFYRAIALRDRARFARLAEHMTDVASFAASLEGAEVAFPRFETSFRRPAQDALAHWDTLDLESVSEWRGILERWVELQSEYDTLRGAAHTLLGALQEICDRRDDRKLRRALLGFVRTLSKIHDGVLDGAQEPAESVELIQDVVEHLRVLAASMGATGPGDDVGPADSETRLADWMSTLELRYPGDFAEERIAEAFRRLSLRWHPDRPTADRRRFEEVVAARDALLSALERRGGS